MKIFRYIILQLVRNLSIILITLIGMLWLTQSLRFIEIIVNYNISIFDYFKFVSFLIPDLISIILPISLVIASIWTYYTLTINHEILVMRASGLSVSQIAKPVIYLGFITAFISLTLNTVITPISFKYFRNFEHYMKTKLSNILFTPGAFSCVKDLTVYVNEILDDAELSLLFIDMPSKKTTIFAESGEYFPSKKTFILKNGYHHSVKQNNIETLSFEELFYDVTPMINTKRERNIKPYEKSIIELLFPEEYDNEESIRKRLKMEGHQRIIMPILNIIDSLIVIILFLSKIYTKRIIKQRRISIVVFSVVIVHTLVHILLNLWMHFEFPIYFIYGFFIILSILLFSYYKKI